MMRSVSMIVALALLLVPAASVRLGEESDVAIRLGDEIVSGLNGSEFDDDSDDLFMDPAYDLDYDEDGEDEDAPAAPVVKEGDIDVDPAVEHEEEEDDETEEDEEEDLEGWGGGGGKGGGGKGKGRGGGGGGGGGEDEEGCGQKEACVMKGNSWTGKGRGKGRDHARKKDATKNAEVRCCRGDSTDKKQARVKMNQYGCNAVKTYDDAWCVCKKHKLQICTPAQIKSGLTQGTGCGYDFKDVWLKGPKGPDECPGDPEGKKDLPKKAPRTTEPPAVTEHTTADPEGPAEHAPQDGAEGDAKPDNGGSGARKGGVSFCDSCRGGGPPCFFPKQSAFDSSWKGPHGTLAFPTNKKGGCKEQATNRKRFDNVNLTLHKSFSAQCTFKAMAPSYNKDSNEKSLKGSLSASKAEVDAIFSQCDYGAEYMTKDQKGIVIIAADDSMKHELKELFKAENKSVDILRGNLLMMTKSLEDKLKLDERAFINTPEDSMILPANQGGSIQIASMLAAGKVRALFYFFNYKKECHRCDISTIVQTCRAVKEHVNDETDCAFDKESGKKLLAALEQENCKKGTCKRVWIK